MVKRTIIGFLFVLGAFSLRANDSYIYWLQDTAKGDGTVSVAGTYEARLVAMNTSTWEWGTGTYLTLYKAGDGGTPNTSVGYDWATVNLVTGIVDNKPRYGNITSLGSGSYTYFIELFNEDGLFAVSKEGLSSADASAYVYTTNTGMDVPSEGFSVPLFTAATPEPTSGMLMLIGSALLALRRKRGISG